MKKFTFFEVRRGTLVLASFTRLIDAVRYWRFDAEKNAVVVRVVVCYDGAGNRTPFDEPLID